MLYTVPQPLFFWCYCFSTEIPYRQDYAYESHNCDLNILGHDLSTDRAKEVFQLEMARSKII